MADKFDNTDSDFSLQFATLFLQVAQQSMDEDEFAAIEMKTIELLAQQQHASNKKRGMLDH